MRDLFKLAGVGANYIRAGMHPILKKR